MIRHHVICINVEYKLFLHLYEQIRVDYNIKKNSPDNSNSVMNVYLK